MIVITSKRLNFNYVFLVSFLLSLLFGYATILSQKPNQIKVNYKGALREMVRTGDISSKYDLKDLNNTKNLFAVGVLEDLKGEIQIFDSQPLNSFSNKKKIAYDKTFDKKATLLVWAVVPKWKTIEIPNMIKSLDQIEDFIETAALKNGIDISNPFPFRISGVVESLNWHIVDWNDNSKVHSHENHIKSGLNGEISKKEVEIIGFFSNDHHGIFTYNTTRLNAHFKTKNNDLAGHVDNFVASDKMILMLPDLD